MDIRSLIRERQRIERDLYRHKAWLDPEQTRRNRSHKALEKEFNQINLSIHLLRGKPESEFRYRHDVRHEFQFGSHSQRTRRGSYRLESAEGTIRHPDEVINWRKTRIGREIDRQLRTSVRRQLGAPRGDDVGHRIPLWAGVDPGERRNVGLQNFQQNQGGGTWSAHEMLMRQWLGRPENHGRHLRASVQEAFRDDPTGRTRSRARKLSVLDDLGGRVIRDNVIHSNPRFENRVRVAVQKPTPGPNHGHGKGSATHQGARLSPGKR
jgi:hypothetical protein